MNVLQTIAGVWTDTGGPAASVPGLCEALAARGQNVTLLTGEGTLAPAVANLAAGVRLVTVPLGSYRLGNFSRAFSAKCLEIGRNSDLLHTHGLWLHPNFATSSAGRALRKPVVVSPRGMLAEWALERGRIRKRLVWWLFQRRCLNEAAFVHATGEAEAREVRRAGVKSPIAVIANGIDLRGFPESDLQKLRAGGRERRVLFLSRVHPKKGLELLLAAWRIVAARHPAVELTIAGPGEPQHIDTLRTQLSHEGFGRVTYVGLVGGRRKLELLARSAVVVLPSRNENYGMVVAEALASGTPVIITEMVPWPEIEARGCGWRVELSASALAHALDEALALEPERIDAMGRQGQLLVREAHTVDAAARQMESAYLWAVGSGPQPACIRSID